MELNDVSDLKGKTIGTTFGTIAHFYLGRFLRFEWHRIFKM